LRDVLNFYAAKAEENGIDLQRDPRSVSATLRSDKVLLARVLDNMIKNAREESSLASISNGPSFFSLSAVNLLLVETTVNGYQLTILLRHGCKLS